MNTTWNKIDIKPTTKQCEESNNMFIAWDGNRRYITYFDRYDGIFRVPIDRGGVTKMEPDTCILRWTTLPEPPEI